MDRFSGVQRRVLFMLVAVWIIDVPAWAGQTFGYTSRKPQRWETKGPPLEEEPGTNLYWHDPFLDTHEHCRYFPPATNGYQPSWYGKAEMLALYREPKSDYVMATLGPTGGILLGTRSFESEFDAGIRALIGKTLGDWYRVEASYFGSYQWDDAAAVRNVDENEPGGSGNLFSPFSDFGNPDAIDELDYNNFASIRFSSALHNGELNLRRRVLMRPGSYEGSFLVGVRYMDIDESFDYLTQSSTPAVSTNAVAISTGNQMIGGQIGLLGQFLAQPRCWVDVEIKGGIYQNHATLHRSYAAERGGQVLNPVSGRDSIDRTSFVGDLSLQFNYQFASCWTFYAGYNAIWVTGLALGADNFESDQSILLLGPTQIDHGGEIVYHGPNLGLVMTY